MAKHKISSHIYEKYGWSKQCTNYLNWIESMVINDFRKLQKNYVERR